MGVRITDANHVCLYDSVSDIAFGPVFYDTDTDSAEDIAELFCQWHFQEHGDPRMNGNDVMDRYAEWCKLVCNEDNEPVLSKMVELIR